MPYWTLLYHIVWATKDRQPLLVGEVETRILGLIRGKAVNLGLTVHALNCMPDHVHLVASIPPNLSVARVIGQVKGVTTAIYNKERGVDDPAIYWQAEYGAFTLDRKRLPVYIAYVNGQKAHHGEDNTIAALERWGETSSIQPARG